MDGFKRRIKRSLQVRLSLWLSIVITLVATSAGFFSYLTAFEEANELQDDILGQISVLFNKYKIPIPTQRDFKYLTGNDEVPHIFVREISAQQPLVKKSASNKIITPYREGPQNITIDSVTYRVFIKTLDSGKRLAVMQEVLLRDEIAQDSALRTVLPFFVLVPILLFLVARLIPQMFQPVRNLIYEIEQRSENEIHPIPENNLPDEILPFVVAINLLLEKTACLISQQQKFIADAAHELRSPLSALSLQAELLGKAELTEFARSRLNKLQLGIMRNQKMVDQLLTLARSQSGFLDEESACSLRQTIKLVLEDLFELVAAKNLDIGLITQNDFQILASDTALRSLIKNLLENAIKYTPANGKINLSIHYTPGELKQFVIEDTGPGIPVQDIERVFEPFYRVPGQNTNGSGLGLSIVREIANQLGATVELEFSNQTTNRGLKVTLTFLT